MSDKFNNNEATQASAKDIKMEWEPKIKCSKATQESKRRLTWFVSPDTNLKRDKQHADRRQQKGAL
jgi:hypothetical protein